MKKTLFFLLTYCTFFAQAQTDFSWWKPTDSPFPVIDGQAWSGEMHDTIQRFPPRAEPSDCLKTIFLLTLQA